MELHALPHLTAEQSLEAEQLLTTEFSLELQQVMEVAGLHLARLTRERILQQGLQGKRLLVLAGRGNVGGAALAAARYLQNGGAKVTVVLAHLPHYLMQVPLHQYNALLKTDCEVLAEEGSVTDLLSLGAFDGIIDGILGYRLKGIPHGEVAQLIQQAGAMATPILAAEVPSGLHPTTGEIHAPAIEAYCTMAIGLPAKGLFSEDARHLVGELFLADCGIPAELYHRMGIDVQLPFAENSIIRVPLTDDLDDVYLDT